VIWRDRTGVSDLIWNGAATPRLASFFIYVASSASLLIVASVMLRNGFGGWVSLLEIAALVEVMDGVITPSIHRRRCTC